MLTEQTSFNKVTVKAVYMFSKVQLKCLLYHPNILTEKLFFFE